jgi:hypothetical protein
LSGPEQASEYRSVASSSQLPPPGQFLTPELESDCARFLQEVKDLARRRAEATAVQPARIYTGPAELSAART